MTSSTRSLVLVGLSCLVLGLALGFAAGRHRPWAWGRHPRPEEHGFRDVESTVRWLDTELDLAPEQEASVAAAITRGKESFHAVYSEMGPRVEACRKAMQDEVKAVLTPAQALRYDELMKEREEKWHKGRRGPGGPGGSERHGGSP